jgi:hypothetical protein
MKKIFNYKQVLVLSALFVASGCSKLDINRDPSNPAIEEATMEVLFPSGVMSSVGRINGDLSIVGGMWAQFWTQNSASSQFRTVDSYDLSNSSTLISRPYTELYSGALADYQLGITKAVEAKDWRFNLMNTVMKAYTYQVLVDLFDKVPYSEALQPTVISQPKFEDGYEIYKALIAEIDAALAKDYRGVIHTDAQTKVDFIFGNRGDATFENQMDNWEKFANTLKLKMYLRMINAKPAEAEAGIRALYTANAKFLDLNAGVNVFENVPNKSNPFFEYNFRRLNTPDNLKASVTLISWLNKNNDPRAEAYYGEDIVATHQGDYGTVVNGASNPIVKATDPAWLITKAESYFMQAEALERYYGGTGAKTMYDNGVTAAFGQVSLTPGALIGAGGVYAYPAAAALNVKIEAIIVQKWASLFGPHALEAFFEQNRTGYPQISPVYSKDPSYVSQYAGRLVYSVNGVTGAGNFPRRFVFPDVEKSRNSNTPAEVPITTKVWWGK